MTNTGPLAPDPDSLGALPVDGGLYLDLQPQPGASAATLFLRRYADGSASVTVTEHRTAPEHRAVSAAAWITPSELAQLANYAAAEVPRGAQLRPVAETTPPPTRPEHDPS
jgi:hypothetical protein